MKISEFTRSVALFTMWLGSSCLMYAQEYLDLASFSYTTAFNSSILDSDTNALIREWNLNVDLPWVLNEDTAIFFGLGANQINVDLVPSSTPETELYAFSLRLGLNVVFSERWSGTFLIIPKVASDFSNGWKKGNQIGAAALFNIRQSNRLKHFFGIYGNKEEFGLLVVPILGVYYKSPNDRFEADVFLPLRADLNLSLGPLTSMGIRFDGLGTSFSIQNQAFPDHYVTRASNDFYVYGQYKIGPSLLLRAKMGYAFFRNYKVYRNEDQVGLSLVGIFFRDNREILNQDILDSFQFKMEMVYRFNFESNKPDPSNSKD